MARVFYDSDANLSFLKGKTIGIIGYGNQGRAQALNMRDSGCNVIIGNRFDEYAKKAREDGFDVFSIEEAVKKSDILCILIPDEVQPYVFKESINPYLKAGQTLDFASGFTIYFKTVVPPNYVDVIMVAPKMIGESVRELFLENSGAPALIGVYQNFSGFALEKALAIAKAIGATRVGALESSFEEEAVTDLFNEQAVPFTLLIKVAFEILVEAGYDPDVVQLELYGSGEWIEIMKAILKYGILEQAKLHSTTSQYGQLSRGTRVITAQVKEEMKRILEEIKNGSFTKEWMEEVKSGYKKLESLRKDLANDLLIKTEKEIRRKLLLTFYKS
ncbi:MAG: ketol-acid reductoisomerase [Candidatus Bathyarchaeia archaeon]